MIRRHIGNEWWLFAQHDHAVLAGAFARYLGGLVEPLRPEAVVAVGLHDRGWTDADATPIVNDRGQPGDVFETPLPRGLEIWRNSSRLALSEGGTYAGLLVSIHSLSLSAMAAAKVLEPPKSGPPDFKMHFAVNKFQHAEIEQQENCRKQLGLRVDAPLTLGLATESIEPAEQQLIYDFRWLQAMDQLSLNLCCTSVMFPSLAHISASPGGSELLIQVTRVDQSSACLRPWPFAVDRVRATIPFKRMTAEHFENDSDFLAACAAAPVERIEFELFPTAPLAATA
jgi:hypothetical protein